MSNATILVARNHHIPGETPPTLDNEGPWAVSYFEGGCGDEWVFWYDPESKQAFISGGDIGWERRRCDEGRDGLA
jgi:hypothetical protein